MEQVKFITFTQFGGFCGDDTELQEDEEIIDEYDTIGEAKQEADKDTYGTRGQFVEVYINNKFYRSYEVE